MKKQLAKPKQKPEQVEIILPLPDPETRGAFIEQRGQQLQRGELTLLDIGKELKLTMRQIEFARLYISEDFYGHGTEAACKAYGFDISIPKEKASAANIANVNLKNAAVLTLINCFLSAEGMNKVHMDKQLVFLATQKNDLKAAAVALKLYYQVTGRLTNKIEMTVKTQQDLSKLSNEELKVMIDLMKKTQIQEEN